MTLTPRVFRMTDGRFRATTEEMPSISYVSHSRADVEMRIERLVQALRSPHVCIDRVTPEGDVILVLSRGGRGQANHRPLALVAG